MNKLSEKNTTRLASLDIPSLALTCFFLSSFSRCLRRWYDS